MITLKITHSKEIDTNRIINTLKNWDWFQEHKYHLILPSGISPESNTNEIQSAVEKDYLDNKIIYQKESSDLLLRWQEHGKKLEEKLISVSLSPQTEYELMLTSYGVGGSYHVSNKIIVNIKRSYQFGLLKTVIHEIIHLSIEKYIQEYKIEHWVKERVVDLLMNEFFPGLDKPQEVPIPTENIDKQFHAFYPDIVKIIKSVSDNNG